MSSLFCVLVLLRAGHAQQFGPAAGNGGYYQIKSSLRTPGLQVSSTSIWHFTVTKVIDSSLFVDCRLISHKGETNGQVFNTDDLLFCRPNTSRDLETLSLLNKPFVCILKRGSLADPSAIGKIFDADIAAWQVQESFANIMKNNTSGYLVGEMLLLFPSLPSGVKTLPDAWTLPDSTILYNVTERTDRSVSYKSVQKDKDAGGKDQVNSHIGRFQLELATGLVLQSGFTNTSTGPFGVNGAQSEQVQEIAITRLPPGEVKSRPIDEDIKTAIVTASRYSSALLPGPVYDSAKTALYYRHYDPLFGNAGWYQLIRLDLLMGTNLMANMTAYDSMLVRIPDSVLAPYPSHLFNKAQHVKHIHPDSIYHTIQYLSREKNSFRGWVQESYAQDFLQLPMGEMLAEIRKEGFTEGKIDSMLKDFAKGRVISKILLERLEKDSDTTIHQEIYPLSLWVRASRDSSNKDSLRRIARELERLGKDKKYSNVHRYGLLVYKQLLAAGDAEDADTLLDDQIAGLEARATDSTADDRYAERNMLAYAYKLKSDAVKSSDPKASMVWLSVAAKYSPAAQKEKAYTSFYDRAFLGSEESYRPAFAEALIKEGNTKDGLMMLTEQLNIDPAILGELQISFTKNFPQLDFYRYFNDVVVKAWKTAPDFSLRSPDGKTGYKLADYRGKWLLIDFWGTWCGPCREEMPKINEFVKKIRDRKDIAFLSIACHDRPEPVTRYLSDSHFQIPVSMADNTVESKYAVPGYPSKFLISPTGTLFPIAFGQDWEKAVEQFSSLHPKKKESKLTQQKKN